jgi:hypothetical protein
MRDALNHLKKEADKQYVAEFARISDSDPWEVRNAYIDVLLHPSDASNRHAFLSRYLSHPTSLEDQTSALSLLEIQKFCLFSFTSCGWFFNDLEGIEPVQNLRYALRAMELMRRFEAWGSPLEAEFLAILARAISNQGKRNGAELFVSSVRQSVPAWLRLMGEAAARLHLQLDSSHPFDLEASRVHVLAHHKEEHQSLFQFHLELHETQESYDAAVLVINDHLERTHLIIVDGADGSEKIRFPVDNTQSIEHITRNIPKALHIRVKDLFIDSLQRINKLAADRNLQRLAEDFRDFARRYSLSLDCLADPSGSLPGAMRESLAVSLNTEIHRVALRSLELVTPDLLAHTKELVDEVQLLGIHLSLAGLGERFHARIRTLLTEAFIQHDSETVTQITGLITLADWMKLDIDKTSLENLAYSAFREFALVQGHGYRTLRPMFEWLNFALPTIEA